MLEKDEGKLYPRSNFYLSWFSMTTLYAFTQYLQTVSSLHFVLPDEQAIPSHFHITEIALVDKTYIDCGGTKRHEQIVTMQLWVV